MSSAGYAWVCSLFFYALLIEAERYSGPWSEHGTSWYTCNRFDETAGVEARDAQSRSRASLERYLHVSYDLD